MVQGLLRTMLHGVTEKEACDELHDDDFNCGISNQWVCRHESLEVLGVRCRPSQPVRIQLATRPLNQEWPQCQGS